jgi:hypothetical protein
MRSTLRGTPLTAPTSPSPRPVHPPASAPSARGVAADGSQEAPTEDQRQADAHANRSQAGMARERILSQLNATAHQGVPALPVDPTLAPNPDDQGAAEDQATAHAASASLPGLPSELQRNVARYGADVDVSHLSLANRSLAASTHQVRLMRAVEHHSYATALQAARSVRQEPLENRGPAFARCLADVDRFSPRQQTAIYRALATQLGGTVNAEPWHDAATRQLHDAIVASPLPPADRESLIRDALRPSRERRGIYF